jgi:hypothetical protein
VNSAEAGKGASEAITCARVRAAAGATVRCERVEGGEIWFSGFMSTPLVSLDQVSILDLRIVLTVSCAKQKEVRIRAVRVNHG